MAVTHVVLACLLAASVSALHMGAPEEVDLVKDTTLSSGGRRRPSGPPGYIPYKGLPQYKPDGIDLFSGCSGKPKIAILLAGRGCPRTEGFREHVLDYLHGKGAKGLSTAEAPDVFVHVKTGEGKGAPTREMCEAASNQISATKSVIEEGWGPAVAPKNLECWKTLKKGTPQSQAGYWHSIQSVFGLMTEHEQHMDEKYDIVIFQRPDHNFRRDVDWHRAKKVEKESPMSWNKLMTGEGSRSVSCSHGHIWGDQMFVLPRPAAYKFGTIFDDLAIPETPRFCNKGRNEDVFWTFQKELEAEGFPTGWTMGRDAP